MKIELSNAILKATLESYGAELISLQDAQGSERIWSGDPAYWTGHSPVLFPIIGSLNGGRTNIKGDFYQMFNHGFARRSEFNIVSQTDTSIVFELVANETTLSQYPYEFNLQISYWLDENTLHTDYSVKNEGLDNMVFQLGTHPAFCYDFDQAKHLSDWYLEFNRTEGFKSLCIENNLINYQTHKPVHNPGKRLHLSTKMFEEGALIFEFLRSNQVALKSLLSSKAVLMEFDSFPHMGVWQPVGAPFICIEPWQGMGDPIGYTGSFQHKPYVVELLSNEIYKASLSMTFI